LLLLVWRISQQPVVAVAAAAAATVAVVQNLKVLMGSLRSSLGMVVVSVAQHLPGMAED
jgi:hypothetical protein